MMGEFMRFYGMAYMDVIDMPVIAFWTLHKQISRINLKECIRDTRAAVASQSKDSFDELSDEMRVMSNEVVKYSGTPDDDELDESGWEALKQMQL